MIKLTNVSKYYNSNNAVALGLRKVNLELHANEFVAVVGESGSGKTTLLNVICGIDSYEEGELYINGEATSYFATSDLEEYRKKYVAFVFQSYNLIDAYTVLQNVEAPMILAGYPTAVARKKALEIIERVGLTKHVRHKATKLSGGQKQRVVIARALAKDCPIIAADEPTGNLDVESGKQVLELLYEISKEKLVVLVTHDYDQVKPYATRKIRMYDGEIAEDIEVRPTNKMDIPFIADSPNAISFWKNFQISWRNLWSVPKKSILMIVVFTFFAFFIALSYGSFLSATSAAGTENNLYFQNTAVNRVVIRRNNLSMLTNEDISQIQSLSGFRAYVDNDYILDLRVSFEQTNATDQFSNYFSVQFLPTSLLKESDLLAGRLATNDSEVVIAISDLERDSALTYINHQYSMVTFSGFNPAAFRTFTVVGVVAGSDYHMSLTSTSNRFAVFFIGENVWSHYGPFAYTQFLTAFRFEGVNNSLEDITVGDAFTYITFRINQFIPANTLLLPKYSTFSFCPSSTSCSATGSITVGDFYQSSTVENISITFVTSDEYRPYIDLNQETFDLLFRPKTYQVSVFTTSEVSVGGFVSQASLLLSGITQKYNVFYPFAATSPNPFDQFFTVFNVIGSTVLLVFTLFASFVISFLIMKAIVNTKLKDYAIFRTIGANRSIITRMIYQESIITGFFAYTIVLLVLLAMQRIGGLVGESVKYYNPFSFVVLFVIVVGMSYLVSTRYIHRIFKESVQRTLRME
ncbi:MAG: ABC transporter ATP-binding protein/permease [Candidatus Izemoplasmatales bacterium]|jgi:putative ABC transport system permease protein|nr:ABC transporter ATP-binding protein/permease [bacterium]MDZ4196971.1 ABC transporter ATP-binding protein/permease [Candidatus Izemoplasmatales bacterium]